MASPSENPESHLSSPLLEAADAEAKAEAEDGDGGEAAGAPDMIARSALPGPLTSVINDLYALPVVREAVTRIENRVPNLSRASNMEALLGHMIGAIANPGCSHCARARPVGIWSACVVVAGYFGGSCSNCHYNSEGVRCSLRPQATAASVAKAVVAAAAANPALLAPPPPSAGPRRSHRRVAPMLIGPNGSGLGAAGPAAPAATAHRRRRRGALAGQIRVARRSRAQITRDIARHHTALGALYLEQAEGMVEEDGDEDEEEEEEDD